MKVRQIFRCLFENEEEQELVYAWYEDMEGFIIYEECRDGTQQRHKMTKTQFYNAYKRIW